MYTSQMIQVQIAHFSSTESGFFHSFFQPFYLVTNILFEKNMILHNSV